MAKFYKKQIRLINEEEGVDNNPNQEYTNVSKQAAQNPSHTASAPLTSFNNSETDNGPEVTVNANNPTSLQTVKAMANNPTIQKAGVTVKVKEGVKREEKLVESISFSKGELSSWLRSI